MSGINPSQINQGSRLDNLEDCTNAADAVSVNDAVYMLASGLVAKASATDETQPCFGIVSDIIDSTTCKVQVFGTISGFDSGMTPSTVYYLSTTSRQLTSTLPSGAGNKRQPVGFAWSSTDLFVCPWVMRTYDAGDTRYIQTFTSQTTVV